MLPEQVRRPRRPCRPEQGVRHVAVNALDPVMFIIVIPWIFLTHEKTGSTVPSTVAHFMNWSLLGWV